MSATENHDMSPAKVAHRLKFLADVLHYNRPIGQWPNELTALDLDVAIEALQRDATHAAVAELIAAAHRAEVSFNTVRGCYERNPGNFMVAMRELEQDGLALRAALAACGAK